MPPPTNPLQRSSSLADRYRALLEIGRALTGTLGLHELYREIYRQTAQVLDADGFYISLCTPGTDEARIVFFRDGGEEELADLSYTASRSIVIRERRAILVHDELESRSLMLLGRDEARVTRSAISAPLLSEGSVIGAISAQSYEAERYTLEELDLLQGIADLAAVAIRNARHVRELEHQREEARRIEEIGRALAASLDPQEVLGRVIDSALELVQAHGASVWMIEGRLARVAAAAGEIALPIGLEWNLEGPLHETLVKRAEVARIDDLAASPLVPGSVRSELQAGSGIAVPLIVGGAVAGALTAGSREVADFDEDAARILGSLAAQAAVALENARLHASVQALSLTDPLTGLANRRHLEIHLRSEVAAARRGRPLVLVLFDLDDFKGYNDTHGHLAGDDALRAFGQILSEEHRAMNLVARYGGDEFVSVLSESGIEGARLYLERVHESVQRNEILGSEGITVSIGMAVFDPETMQSPADLVRAADASLYSEKSSRGGIG